MTSSSNIASVSPRNIALASSSNIALKAIRDSNNVNDLILNELKIHHKCRNPRVIPFYGITKSPEGNDYAMPIDSETELALSVLDGLRPDIVKGTPDFYVNIMERCWNPEPSGRPDASLLPKLFEEMMESCKIVDNNKDYNLVPPHHSNSNSVISGSTQDYLTVAYEYTLREEREEYCRSSIEKFEPRNSKFERMVECRKFKENEDPRYITQTYKFSLDSLNKNYDDDYNARNTGIINRGTVPVVPVDGCKLQ
ncbi:unnamed protein product [Rhizophagus irregularis]|nr:unnamed protein product [Rhizophagus irregularis]